jgi:hypothetical protein
MKASHTKRRSRPYDVLRVHGTGRVHPEVPHSGDPLRVAAIDASGIPCASDGASWTGLLPVRARIHRAGEHGRGLERAGVLTPYAMQVIAEDAAHAGVGARLEMTVPRSTDDERMRALRRTMAPLERYGVTVSVRRRLYDATV